MDIEEQRKKIEEQTRLIRGYEKKEPVKLYEVGKILRWKKTGERVKITNLSFLSNNPANFLNYEARKEGKKGIFAVYHEDLEEIKEIQVLTVIYGR